MGSVLRWLGYGWPLTAAVAVLSVPVALVLADAIMRAFRRRLAPVLATEAMKTTINELDGDEWYVIRQFERTNTVQLAADVPAVAGLVSKGVLSCAIRNGWRKRGDDGEIHAYFPMRLTPIARRVLQERGR